MPSLRHLAPFFLSVLLLAPSAAYAQPDYRERSDRGPGDLVDFAVTLGYDFWAVAKSPFELDRGGWFKVSTVAMTFGYLYHYDEEIHRATQQNRDGGVLGAIEDVGSTFEILGLMGETGRYYATGIAVGYVFKWEKLERISTDILFSHFVGGIIRQGFVRIVDRSRPNERKGVYHYGDGGTSMPSGHSSTIFQLATVLSHHFPMWWTKTAFYGVAGCVAVQRVTVEQHWASDSFLGAAFGHAVGRLVVGENDRRGYLVTPAIMPSTGAAGIAIHVEF